MTRYTLPITLSAMLAWMSTLSAQATITNYYNAPAYLTPQNAGVSNQPGGAFPSFNAPSPTFGAYSSQPGGFGAFAPAPGAYTQPAAYATPGAYNTVGGVVTGNAGYPTPTSSAVVPTASGSLVQQIYPQPAVPNPPIQQAGTQATSFTPFPVQLALPPYQRVAPPDAIIPGIATIQDGKWVVRDYFYNLSPQISIKVEVIKPQDKYIPISQELLQNRVTQLLQEVNISPEAAPIECQPPLPLFYVMVMAYPCERRCVGFITAQLYEQARPDRIDVDLNGVWQAVTWERQALVSSSCDDFAQEVGETIDEFARGFAKTYYFYNHPPERPCFVTDEDP